MISIIGTGNMGEAMLRGILQAGLVAPNQVRASDSRSAQRQHLAEKYAVACYSNNIEAVTGATIVILAVKPQILEGVLAEVGPHIDKDATVISVAAGRSTQWIEQRLPPSLHVVRAMPNIASLVLAGATGLCRGSCGNEKDMTIASTIFESIGTAVTVPEGLMDAVTGLSGSGPAYILMVIEALSDAGVKVGLSRWDASTLACQTVLGTAKLVMETQEHPGRLKDMVCSPGGTAIAAVHTLEQGGLRTTLINAVERATQRSAELGADVLRKS